MTVLAPTQTGTTAKQAFKIEMWSKLILRALRDSGAMLECVNRDYEGEIKSKGDTVHIRSLVDVTINTHNDATPIQYEKLRANDQTLVIDQAKNFAFLVTDIEQVQSDIKYAQKYINEVKKQIVNTKDAYLHALGIAGVDAGNQMGTQAVTASNIYATLVDMFVKLADSNAIDDNGLAADGKRPFLILPPKVIGIIKNSDEAKHATNLGDATVRKGAIMQYAGFDIKQSTVVKGTTSGGSTSFDILAGTSEGITFADQINKVESLKDVDFFGDHFRGLYLYGGKVVQPKALASATFTV